MFELSENLGVVLKFPQSPWMLSACELQLAKKTVQVLKPVERNVWTSIHHGQ